MEVTGKQEQYTQARRAMGADGATGYTVYKARTGTSLFDRKIVDNGLSMDLAQVRQLLSPREMQCLEMKCRGMQVKEIAAALEISVHTVRNYVSFVYDKLGIRNPVILCSLIREAQVREMTMKERRGHLNGKNGSTDGCVDCVD